MAAPAIGQLYLVTFEGRLAGQTTLSTFWYRLDALGNALSVEALYGDMNDVIQDADGLADLFARCCPDDWAFPNVWIQCVAPVRYAKHIFTNGDIGGDGPALTANVDAVILRRGELANRRNVSTLHVPLALTDSNALDGVLLNAGVKPKLVELAAKMLEPIPLPGSTPGRMIPVIYNPLPKPPLPKASYPIVSTAVEETVRVMTRRTVGRGI